MRWFHKCEWEVIVKTVAPPVKRAVEVEGCNVNSLNKMALGCTTVLLQCPICKQLRKEEMLGEPVNV